MVYALWIYTGISAQNNKSKPFNDKIGFQKVHYFIDGLDIKI